MVRYTAAARSATARAARLRWSGGATDVSTTCSAIGAPLSTRCSDFADVGAGPVGYWGLSMGTIFGAPLVAAEPRIRVAVLGLMGITGPTERYRQRIRDAAAAIACPVLFLMQLHDELFTREQYLDLFDRMVSDDKRIHANPGLHPEVPVEELDYSAEFLTRYLAGEGKTKRKVGFTVSQ